MTNSVHYAPSLPVEETTEPEIGVILSEPISKRIFDVVFALLGLISSAPLWVLIALAIKLEDRGPIFHINHRVGK
ncbi:MAG: sugar transferase, partial [Gemmatimonadota bacterium]|nr:sugar transferase [Gemmatimonadota bacterium]